MGTEEFWVPALLTAVSAGSQYVNSTNAQQRSNSAQVQNIEEQEAIQQKANQQVGALTKQITNNSPQTLADQLTGSFVDNLRKNAVGSQTSAGTTSAPINFGASTSGLPPNVGGSSRYKSDVASNQNQVEDYGNQEATLQGNIVAPTLQRQNEALSMEDLGTKLNLEGAQSYTQNFVNQLRAQAGGVQSPWLTLLGSAAGGAANTLSKNWGPSGSGLPDNSWAFNPNTNQLTGAGAQSILDNL